VSEILSSCVIFEVESVIIPVLRAVAGKRQVEIDSEDWRGVLVQLKSGTVL
jgi:hypothetical protein